MFCPPFGLGKTFYGGTQSIDVSSSYANVGGIGLEGLEGTFDDVLVNVGAPNSAPRSGDVVKARLVRNTSGVTLIGSRLVTYATGHRLKRVDGYARTLATEVAGVVDPLLGSTGVRDGDLFWLIEEGVVDLVTDKSNQATDFAARDPLIAATDAAVNATTTNVTNTAGKVSKYPASFTATQTTDGTALSYNRNCFGIAMSAALTNSTNTALRVHVKIPRN
jgi:hypothetical protein